MPLEDARRAAALKFGSVASTQESVRDRHGLPVVESILKDIGYALRGMRKSPGFTTVMILTLALGIGAKTAIFSLVNQILLHPRGISHPERLTVVRTKYEKLGRKNIPDSAVLTFADVRDSRAVFEHSACNARDAVNYTGGATPQSLRAEAVSSEMVRCIWSKTESPGGCLRRMRINPATSIVSLFWRTRHGSGFLAQTRR